MRQSFSRCLSAQDGDPTIQRLADITKPISPPPAHIAKIYFSPIFVTYNGNSVAINNPCQDTEDLECYCCSGKGPYVVCPTRTINHLDNKDNYKVEDVLEGILEPTQDESQHVPAKDGLPMLVVLCILMALKAEIEG